MKKLIAALAASLVLSGCMMAARRVAHRVESTINPPAIQTSGASVPKAVNDNLLAIVKSGVSGVTAIVMKDGKQLYRVDIGKIDASTQYDIASASKWMTAALVMTVVDEGKLSLDEPISKVLPEFSGEKSTITLRMLLAQTAGTGSLRKGHIDISQDPRITLAESAAEVAKRPLAHPPGAVFEYGGPGFQVAGAMVEKVTGKRWADLFNERIAIPLGMTSTRWEHPRRGARVAASETLNPLLQGGVVTTADDYMKFLTMLAANGRFKDHQILSPQAIAAMETAQTLGLERGFMPPGVSEGAQYGLGNWCERWDADKHCTLVSSPGAFGTLPFIDRKSGIYGVFFLKDFLVRVGPRLREARQAILAEY
ncbi:CubicO group peptidase (beta-lactamase class C family) [Rhizomicrobium palustre]|uniref:CubicO group peptidase (Beta-lactamase class C family) n=1 Tax=Rhizomicrobium palustre TaxID=189966 RepID=A0A846N144_9PROT|nr:serine hydrolase domain-containing protein [Rhizomicrobium palustre]NIK89648.1 CubicO group peptidase (beta-lactamase class C family) [Rhizomicrobium palustre]